MELVNFIKLKIYKKIYKFYQFIKMMRYLLDSENRKYEHINNMLG